MSDSNLKLEDLIGNVQKETEKERIESVAIIGAGLMGRGIAQTISAAGFDVLVIEQSKDMLEKAQAALKETMQREIHRWSMTSSEMKSILSKITWSTKIEDVKNADLIIEAISENLELKQEMFKKLDIIAKEETIFVTNTAALSLSEIASVTNRKDRILGMHFLNPVPKIPLVELIREYQTSNHTLETIKDFAVKIGKTPIEVFEYPGFVTTRAIVPMLNEAMHILMEGLASAKDIDTAMKLGYKFNTGPLELADQMGLDEVLRWMESLWQKLGELRFRPCPLLRRLVRERKLGVKTGEGFFKYNEYGKIIE